MRDIDFGASLSYAIEKFKTNLEFCLIGAIILIVPFTVVCYAGSLVFGVLGVFLGKMGMSDLAVTIVTQGLATVFNLIAGMVVLAPLTVGFFAEVRSMRDGNAPQLPRILDGYKLLPAAAGGYLLSTLIFYAGFILCIIPGILVLPITWIVPMLIVRGETGGYGLDAVKKSLNLLKAAPILILWFLLAGLISIIGILACCVGVIATMPIALIAMSHMLDQALGDDGQDDDGSDGSDGSDEIGGGVVGVGEPQ